MRYLRAKDLVRKSQSYHCDPAAGEAISHVDAEIKAKQESEMRYRDLLATILYISDLAGFEISGTMEFKDLKTGKVWK